MSDFFDEIKTSSNPPTYKYLVNGQWKESKSKQVTELYSPIDNTIVGLLQSIDTDEINEVVESARETQKEWGKIPLWQRAKIGHQAAKNIADNVDVLTDLLIREVGKPKKAARDEVERTVELIDYYSEELLRMKGELLSADAWPGFKNNKLALVERVPLGVILTIPPFNYPINETAPKIVAALLTGNSVVLKPPTQGAICALHLAACFAKTDLPKGVLNVALGQGSKIGDTLVTHKDISCINFTGGTEVAKHIAQIAGFGKKLVMGLSGKDASLVLADADLDLAAKEISSGAFSYSGQRCTGIKRVLVEDGVADDLGKKLVEIVGKNFVLGDPNDEKFTLGPVVSDKVADYVEELIKDAINKGANVLCGNRRQGKYMEATILDHVTSEMRVAWEEPFGPVLPIMRVKNWQEALKLANKSEYGLQASVFTANSDLAFEIARDLEVGTVQINAKDARGPDHFPFMGVKDSGIGMVQGAKYLLEEMTRIKTIVLNLRIS